MTHPQAVTRPGPDTPSRGVHRPLRPAWNCRTCGGEWPCPPGKAELIIMYADDRVGLLVYLAGLLVDAVRDIDGTPPPALLDRFVRWARYDGPG